MKASLVKKKLLPQFCFDGKFCSKKNEFTVVVLTNFTIVTHLQVYHTPMRNLKKDYLLLYEKVYIEYFEKTRLVKKLRSKLLHRHDLTRIYVDFKQ